MSIKMDHGTALLICTQLFSLGRVTFHGNPYVGVSAYACIPKKAPERKQRDPKKYPTNMPNHSSIRTDAGSTNRGWENTAPVRKPIEPKR